jgi:uncharacterized protein YlxP (DUF503 family)
LDDNPVFYGVGCFDLHLPHSRSLKDKRAVMNSLKGRLSEKARISVIDTGPQDLWQRAALAVCLVAREEAQVRSSLSSLLRAVEADDRVVVLGFRTRIGSLDDAPVEGES